MRAAGGISDWESGVMYSDGVWVECGRGKLNLQLVYDHSEGKELQRPGKVEDKRLQEGWWGQRLVPFSLW